MGLIYTFQDMVNPGKHKVGKCREFCGDDCDHCNSFGSSTSGAGYSTGCFIRTAHREDVPALRRIYNYEVTHGIATFDEEPRTLEDRTEWFEAHRTPEHPLIVATKEGIILGYASLSDYRPKDAYKSTVELSVYIDPEYRGRGVATALMASVLRIAKRNETIENVISVITSGNEASVKLHNRFGFTLAGSIPHVAVKNGQILGTDTYYLLTKQDSQEQ